MKYILLWVIALVLALTFTLSAGKSGKDKKVVTRSESAGTKLLKQIPGKGASPKCSEGKCS
jgi:hypothetical protein